LIESYVIAMLGIAALAAAWVGVQLAWGRSFPTEEAEPDVLARRGGCGDCARPGPCGRTHEAPKRRRSALRATTVSDVAELPSEKEERP